MLDSLDPSWLDPLFCGGSQRNLERSDAELGAPNAGPNHDGSNSQLWPTQRTFRKETSAHLPFVSLGEGPEGTSGRQWEKKYHDYLRHCQGKLRHFNYNYATFRYLCSCDRIRHKTLWIVTTISDDFATIYDKTRRNFGHPLLCLLSWPFANFWHRLEVWKIKKTCSLARTQSASKWEI